ncbi:MAG: beta-ketoacyl-ACP reductase [Bacteroidetes bacterium]|nr:beta-ketoacyl-ACP reductase [Bacteroidota bacterium]
MRLKGKTAIITGGANGIGKATVEKFVNEGAAVAIWDISADKGQALADHYVSKNKQVRFYAVDTTDPDAVTRAAAKVAEDFGSIHILINNAGITRDATMKKITQEQWDQVIAVNLSGVFHCTKALGPYLIESGAGRILTASSIVGLTGNFGQTNYAATKAGVIGMSNVWAREYGPKGVTSNIVAPGFIATEMMETIPEKVLDSFRDRTPLGRMGTPAEIANAYAFLASDEAAFINGATLSVDGGVIL